MNRVLAVTVSIVLLVAPFGLISSAQAAPTKFKNCTQLNKKYPNGVALNASTAKKSVAAGNGKPTVNKSVYEANSKRLDRKRSGVLCARLLMAEPTVSELKTEWGYLRVTEVKAPPVGGCTDVPYELDIRNSANTGLGFIISIKDDFGNMVAEARPVDYPNGVYPLAMRVCGQEWVQDPYVPNGIGARLKAAPKGDYNVELAKVSLSGISRSSMSYEIL